MEHGTLDFVLSPNRRIDNPDMSQGRCLLFRGTRYEQVLTRESGRPLTREDVAPDVAGGEAMVVERACENEVPGTEISLPCRVEACTVSR
jgi:hypothetical protein